MCSKHPAITAAVITFNSAHYIKDCISSLLIAGLDEHAIMVVDDGSSDETLKIVGDTFPGVGVYCLGGNFGHSRACNEAIKNAVTEWVVLIDHDTVVHEDWHKELVAAIHCHPEAGIIVSRAVFEDDRKTIHSDGGYAHYIGNMILRNGFLRLHDANNEVAALGAAGTTSMALKREKALAVGLFDEDFFIYLNDFEFSLRMRLMGESIFCAPKSIIYHKGGSQGVSFRGKGKYPPMRAYYILRNRWFLILKLYSAKTLLLCFPALLLYEAMLLAMSLKKGVFCQHAKAWYWLITHFSQILKSRSAVQMHRKLSDRSLLTSGKMTFVPGVINGGVMKAFKMLLDGFFTFYWRGVCIFL
jgi:GT2 family glycosyltransferase